MGEETDILVRRSGFQQFVKHLTVIPPIIIDGALYTLLAMVLFLQNQFASDEAGKFISLELLFYIKTVVGVFAAGLLAVKLFRSTAFAEHKQQKKADDSGQTQVVETKPTDTSKVT